MREPTPVAPPRKKMSGCVIALLIVGALLVLTCLVGSALTYQAMQNPEVAKVISALGKGTDAMMKGAKAPGTDALRAAGCDPALVVPLDEVMELVSQFVDAGDDADDFSGNIVLCDVASAINAIECDTVAATYVKAASPKTSFMVSVRTRRDGQTVCEASYDSSGARKP